MEKEMSFEEALAQLETIVGKLESGDVPLEQAIELFQEGMHLSNFCTKKLEHVEKKIEMLMETEQGLRKQEFHSSELDKDGTA